jgi:cardiolipin synthase
LTAIRFILIPFFAYFLYIEYYSVALVFFLSGGITDVMDGYIARKYNMVTSFGKLADPVADKLMQITALVLLTLHNRIPVFVLIIVVAKESFMGLGSILLYRKEKHVVSANWYGKLATVVFYFAIIAVIVFDLKEPLSGILVGVAVLPTLFAFVMYSFTYRQIRSDSQK